MTTPWQRLAAIVRAWRDRREDGETEVYDFIAREINRQEEFYEHGNGGDWPITPRGELCVALVYAAMQAEVVAESGELRDTMRINRLLHEAIQVRREIMGQAEIESTMPAALREVHETNDC